jgi:hypothetical protein
MPNDLESSDQVLPSPGGCRWCGVDARDHLQRWSAPVGWHRWVPPTLEQRKERMRARRRHAQEGAGEASLCLLSG